jgi:hypothetical protein
MSNWLLDHLFGMKRGEAAAPAVEKTPIIGTVVDEVNAFAGLVPVKSTTTTVTTLDPAVEAEVEKVAVAVIHFVNSKLTAVGVPAQDDAALDAELAAFIRQETGGTVDVTPEFPAGG